MSIVDTALSGWMSNEMNKDNISSTKAINRMNIDWARELNQMSRDDYRRQIRNRVADAKAAGIHPLAALGMQGYSPTYSAPDLNVPRKDHMPNIDIGLEQAAPFIAELGRAGLYASEAELNKARTDQIRQQVEASKAARVSQDSNVNQDGTGNVQQTLLTGPTGGKMTTSPSSNAEAVEQEYGDIASEIYSLWRLAVDSMRNLGVTEGVSRSFDPLPKSRRWRHKGKAGSLKRRN